LNHAHKVDRLADGDEQLVSFKQGYAKLAPGPQSFFLLNLLPIPVLDGGEALLLVMEKLRGRTFTRTTRIVAYSLGAALVAMWSLSSMMSELLRP